MHKLAEDNVTIHKFWFPRRFSQLRNARGMMEESIQQARETIWMMAKVRFVLP